MRVKTARLRELLRDIGTAQAALNDFVLSGSLNGKDGWTESIEVLRLRLDGLRRTVERADLEAFLLGPVAEAEDGDRLSRQAAEAPLPVVVRLDERRAA